MTPGEFRLRVCYRKADRLRWLSHLEVAHAIERTVRRSALPYAVTQGFSPHMKIAFGPALPVGTGSEREYADLWLTRYTEASDALARLKESAPADLAPFQARYVGDKDPSLAASLTIALYRVELTGKEIDPTEVHAGLERVLERRELQVEHKGKTKVFDLGRSVPKDVRVEVEDGGVVMMLPVRMGPEGSLRPSVLVQAVIAEAHIDVSAVHTTRLDLLVESDEGGWSRPV